MIPCQDRLLKKFDKVYRLFRKEVVCGCKPHLRSAIYLNDILSHGKEIVRLYGNIERAPQSPFVTIFCYEKGRKGYEKETAMLIEELFKQRLAGMESPDGHNINPAFPKIIYVLTEENIKPGHKLTQLAAECSSKRMVPDYISEKKMKEYKEGNCFSMMGK